MVDVVPQLLLVFFGDEEAGWIDVGGFAVAAVNDFDVGAGFTGNADAVVDNAVLFEGTHEAFFVISAHEAGGAATLAGTPVVRGLFRLVDWQTRRETLRREAAEAGEGGPELIDLRLVRAGKELHYEIGRASCRERV